MSTVKTSSNSFKFLGILGLFAGCLLTACGERGSSQKTPSAATQKSAQATPCAYAVGRPSKNNAELFIASGEGNIRRVEQAITAGNHLNATDHLKRTPLFAAAFCNRPEVIDFLIDKGSDVNTSDFIGMTSLHAAVIAGGSEAAQALLSKGANINFQSATGRTPLHLAAATNQAEMIELLVERGADTQIPDKNGIDAMALAQHNGYPAVAAAIAKWQEKQKNSIPQ